VRTARINLNTALPGLVLDTNAVLDWLVFNDAGMAPVTAAIAGASVQWQVCPRMREELTRTLGYANLAKWQPDPLRVMAAFDQHAQMHPAPPASPQHLRCADSDDQVFIDLALTTGARWLLTHDRALLKLARRAAPLGLVVQQPQAWRNPHLSQ
jgi:predicted nucleic acid-binding protein